MLPSIHDSSFKGAFLRSLTSILYINELRFHMNEKIYLICKEFFMSVPVVIFTRKNFFLLEAINEKISIIQAAGLIEYWHSQSVDQRFLNAQIPTEAKMLTCQHLSGCFILLTGGLFAAFVVFTIEIGYKIVQSKLRSDKMKSEFRISKIDRNTVKR